MSAKELLMSVKAAEEKYLLSKELAERSRENLYHRCVTCSDIPGAEVHDNTQERNLVALLDLDAQAKQDRAEYFRIKKYVFDLINTLDSPKEREVLIRRYLYYDDWKKVMERMCYSERQVHRYHEQALKHLAEKLSVNVSKCQ